jgi:hypothetical protein
MVGSMTEGILGSLVGTLDVDGSVGTRDDRMMITAMVVASEICG